jgi:hypothetical protein
MKIWKFEFEVADRVEVEMPEGAFVLSAGVQNPGKICVWAIVNPDARKQKRIFQVRGTGHEVFMVMANKFVGTVFDGVFVWHVFEG